MFSADSELSPSDHLGLPENTTGRVEDDTTFCLERWGHFIQGQMTPTPPTLVCLHDIVAQ